MGIFSFGKKDDAAPRRRGAEAGSSRRSSQSTRVERRSRRPDRSGDAEAMLLDPTLPEKQRARRRLVGAIALVVAAIVVLPMVLDSHPKPVTDDIAIDIPSRPTDKADARDDAEDTQAGVAPDNPGASGLAAAPAASTIAPVAPAQSAQNPGGPGAQAAAPSQATPSGKTTQKTPQTAQTSAPAPSKPAAQQQPSANAATASRSAQPDASSATSQQAETDTGAESGPADDSGTPAAPPGARFAVQLGSFTGDAAARNWVTKLKAAGVPAYTEHRKQPDGSTRTLLLAGPFPDRAAASAAIAKVRGAGLMAGADGAAD